MTNENEVVSYARTHTRATCMSASTIVGAGFVDGKLCQQNRAIVFFR